MVRPVLPLSCRFTPSCSEFAILALEEHGTWDGGLLALGRLARCHPWNPGGHDPVRAREG